MANRRKDVFPQFMSFSGTESAANTFTTVRIQLPVARRPGAKKITVIELLQVWFQPVNEEFANADIWDTVLMFRDAATLPDMSDPNVFYQKQRRITVFTTGAVVTEEPSITRYDSGGGKGFLLATDSIFVGILGTSQSAALTANYKLLYRFVEVGLQEYIGIVQQQSAQT